MLKKIRLKNFRSFRNIEIEPLRRINLIAGLNNAGKTGLLEAIFMGLQPDLASRTQQSGPNGFQNTFRNFSSGLDQNLHFWPWLFTDRDTSKPVTINLFAEDGKEQSVFFCASGTSVIHQGTVTPVLWDNGVFQMTYPRGQKFWISRPTAFGTNPSDPVQDAIDYNRVVLKRAKNKVEALLKIVDARVQSIEALQIGTQPALYVDIGFQEMIPVAHLGEGFCRLLTICSELLAGEAKVLLIDEIENGLHHSVLPMVWKGLIAASRELNVQIFATTHSAECIFAADQAARESKEYDLNLIRLDRVDGEIKSTVIGEEGLAVARDNDWELR